MNEENLSKSYYKCGGNNLAKQANIGKSIIAIDWQTMNKLTSISVGDYGLGVNNSNKAIVGETIKSNIKGAKATLILPNTNI